jgi:hypothetical protein
MSYRDRPLNDSFNADREKIKKLLAKRKREKPFDKQMDDKLNKLTVAQEALCRHYATMNGVTNGGVLLFLELMGKVVDESFVKVYEVIDKFYNHNMRNYGFNIVCQALKQIKEELEGLI